jgi:hypothetical protein
MSNLAFYRKNTTLLICPVDKEAPIIEVKIIDKAQGKSGSKMLIKVEAPFPIDLFGNKHKSVDGIFVEPQARAWLRLQDWKVIGRIEKPKPIEKPK